MIPFTEALVHTAVHEAGHAVADLEVGLGLLDIELVKDEYYDFIGAGFCGSLKALQKTRKDIISRVVVCYSGMTAEDEVFLEHYSGASKDICRLTRALEDYFTILGYERDPEQPIIQSSYLVEVNTCSYSDKIKNKALECEKYSREIVKKHKSLLIKLAKFVIYNALTEGKLTTYFNCKSISELEDFLKPYNLQIDKVRFEDAIKDDESFAHNIHMRTEEAREKDKCKKEKSKGENDC